MAHKKPQKSILDPTVPRRLKDFFEAREYEHIRKQVYDEFQEWVARRRRDQRLLIWRNGRLLSLNEDSSIRVLSREEATELWLSESDRDVPANKPTQPPNLLGDYLLCLFISDQNRKVIARELEECYLEIQATHGRRKAQFWYWTRVIGNVVACWYKPLLKVASLSGLGALLRHSKILGDVLKKIGLS